MVRWMCWYPLSSAGPNNISQTKENYLLCISVYICVVISLMFQFLLVSVDFKTLRMVFTQRGEYVTGSTFVTSMSSLLNKEQPELYQISIIMGISSSRNIFNG